MSEFNADEFKRRVAIEMGLDLSKHPNAITWSKLLLPCDENKHPQVAYRFDLSIGKNHAIAVPPFFSMDYTRYVSGFFKYQIKKWEAESKEQLRPITLIESMPGHLSVANRKLDTSNPLDAAILEFVFRFNMKADGLSADEIEALWRQSPWSKGD